MNLLLQTPGKALRKVNLMQGLRRDQVEIFKADLTILFERLKPGDPRNLYNNILAVFLKSAGYISGGMTCRKWRLFWQRWQWRPEA
jgi:hypothetical protein